MLSIVSISLCYHGNAIAIELCVELKSSSSDYARARDGVHRWPSCTAFSPKSQKIRGDIDNIGTMTGGEVFGHTHNMAQMMVDGITT